jgi:uncharacterized protein YkwD
MKNLKLIFKAFLCCSVLFLSPPAFTVNASHVKAEGINAQMILHYVNLYRAKRHLSPLKLNSAISAEATHHSRDMANKAIPFGHRYFDTRIRHIYSEIKDCRAGAENVAFYKTNAKKLVDAWVASPGHRQNIVGNYNLTGIGIAYGKKGWAYYTQIFVRKDEGKAQG